MLHVCIDGIAKTVKDQHKFKWSVGNLSLIQAKKRDEYDSENGGGHGKFDDVIGEDHREAKVAKEGTLPEVEAQAETSKRNGGASGVINIMKQIQKDGLTLPTKCVEVNIASSLINSTNEFPKVTRTPKNGGILILDDMHNDVSPMESEATIDKLNEDVQDAKRVRKASRWLQFPYEQMDGPKRVKKSLFGNYAVMVSTEYLDAEHIEAANAYINTLIENGKHRKDVVVKIPAPDVDICTADMLGDIVINDYCKQIKKHSKVPDRHILSTWVSKWLLDRAAGRVTGRKTKMEILAYFPMNVNGNHWINVLMHNTNKEFQVLDSLGPIDRIIHKTIHTLKAQIVIDIAAANKQVESKFPDVSAWLIMEYEMPKQTNGLPCIVASFPTKAESFSPPVMSSSSLWCLIHALELGFELLEPPGA
ncbi:hypothetical protein D1007_46737 [Hordeum vulgare]|nr:hypothetical protein D1007_46737 [Hordeum vulgare]